MVEGVFPSPMIVRGEGQYSGDESQNVIRFAGCEKRAMPTVVGNDEHAHEKPSRQDRQWHSDPPGHRQTEGHQIPKGRIRNERVDDLPNAAPDSGLLVSGHNLLPGRRVWAALVLNSLLRRFGATLAFNSRRFFGFDTTHRRDRRPADAFG